MAPPGGLHFSHLGCNACGHSQLAHGNTQCSLRLIPLSSHSWQNTQVCSQRQIRASPMSLEPHIPVAQVSGTGRRHANLSISVDYPQENKWEALSFGGSPPGLALRDPKKACILRIPPKEGTRGVKWAHPSEKSERASESLQGWLVKAFLSQSQLLKTSGGNCSFKC